MFGKRRRRKAPQDEASLLTEALADLAYDQRRKARRKQRRSLRWPAWLDKRVVAGVVLLFLLVVADGVRRENAEFYATVTNLGGQVTMTATDGQPRQAVKLRQRLQDNNSIFTGPAAWAELSFVDGSVLLVDANSSCKIERLEYERGGRWRSRSFYLTAGRLFARVGLNFGKKSEMRVYTPACVAAVRGTRFSVAFDTMTGQATTVCQEGTVQVQGFTGRPMFVNPGGECTALPGGGATLPELAPATAMTPFSYASLNRAIRPEPWYQLAELTITQWLDTPLSILGIGRSSWFIGCLDSAKRSACQEQLHRIQTNLEGETRYPLWVNPATLAQLDIRNPAAVKMMLKTFDGAALESYVSDGRTFTITARARDSQRTRYELTPSGVSRAGNQG